MDTTKAIRLNGSPRIDHEDVIIMRKPTRAAANGARSDP